MSISVFDLYSIGIGPSSSHTVGPMRAAYMFASLLGKEALFNATYTLKIDLYGSLALTGKGHATDIAVLMGLEGERPCTIDPSVIPARIESISKNHTLNLLAKKQIPFSIANQLLFHKDKQLPFHPNGMRFTAFDHENKTLIERVYYSVGGGFIVDHEHANKEGHLGEENHKLPYPFSSGDELLAHCKKTGLSVQQLVLENEKTWRTEDQIRKGLLHIWKVMKDCVIRGYTSAPGVLPGGLEVQRRAPGIYQHLLEQDKAKIKDPVEVMKWVSLWALAVNEENAAGNRVVTAPTNGAAGIIPAVLHYYEKFTENASDEGIIDFMLTAGAIGILYKVGASISAAEMGCMGEVGVACSMAAAGLTAAIKGTPEQIENAAEIGMEHNLGLTCDPVMGLVQIPCIERNTMGSIKAINASLLAMLNLDGKHRVSLDQVISTMRQTGHDMQSIYKETSLGGLAVNVPEC
jgi:L-serine dehydratase